MRRGSAARQDGAAKRDSLRKRGSAAARADPSTSALPGFILVILLLTGGAAADFLGPEPYTGLPLLTGAPLVAGAMLSFRASAALVTLACVVSVLLDIRLERPTMALIVDLASVAAIGLLALTLNRLLARQNRRLAQARDVAEAAQRAVLPDPPIRVGPLRVAARYETAETEARIGGDLYAVQSTPFGIRAIIGDVRGKGLQAVATVSVAIGAFRQEAEHAPTLGELARRLDEALSREDARRKAVLAQGTDDSREVADGEVSEDFTTAVLAEVGAEGTVRLVNRGHPPPYLVADGTVVRLDPRRPELPLGLGPLDSGAAVPAPDTFPLPAGSALLLVTDGVTEARDRTGAFYDPCTARLDLPADPHPAELVDALVASVARWTGGPAQDDMAIMALAPSRAEPPSGAPVDPLI